MKKETQNPVNSTTMITSLFCLIFLLSPQIIIAADPPYKFTEHTLLNCGASTRRTSSDGQSWEGDAGTKLSPDISSSTLSSPATTDQDSSITSAVPYVTARIIHSKFSYIFPLSSGQKILRLYFYPATYSAGSGGAAQSFDQAQSFFTVTANQYTLLTNFSASLTASGQNPAATYFVKEFIVNVQQTQALNLTFLPSPDSYAFINGIEVVSVPADFYMGSHNLKKPLRFVNSPNAPFGFDQNGTAFETLYRLNVGGVTIAGVGDTGMFRNWLQDDRFLASGIGNPLSNETMPLTYSATQTPNYSAPVTVYQTARAMGTMANQTPAVNLTWSFQVDTGFFYLFRLHFCEFQPGLFFKEGQRVFTVFIGNLTAELDVDIIHLAGGPGIPMFRDYVLSVANPAGGTSKKDLFLALAPARQFDPVYYDAFLNGLEIFKLSTSDGNLAGVNPDLPLNPGSSSPNSQQLGSRKKKSSIAMIAGIIGGVAGAAALLFLLILFIRRRRRGTTDFDGKSGTKSSWAPLSTQSKSTLTAGSTYGSSPLPYDLCRRFLLEEIKTATSDFDPALVIGTGGFGKVYKGFVDNNLTAVAIKRLDTTSRQGAHEFRTEIEMLSNLRHVHLVSLIGYCDENKEMILVYDYMSNGTLRDHLYRTENPPLTWKSRLQVAAGAARGLNYLHSGAKHNIIHRDVKSTNILLDDKFVAKVSDFGLSKLGPTGGHQSHVSTVVKGSFGYVDPEYYKKQQLTEKSDVYSFGVVLFEVLCARPAIVATLSRDQVNLAEWARRCNKKGTIDQMVDTNLRGQIAPECLKSYSDIAMNCLKDQGSDRPAMSDVVWSLEFALQLQEAADKDGDNREHPIIFAPFSPETDASTISIDDESATLTGGMLTSSCMMRGQSDTTGGMTSSTDSTTDDKLKSASVFSEINNPAGR